MIGLICFVLAVLASPFKSKLRAPRRNRPDGEGGRGLQNQRNRGWASKSGEDRIRRSGRTETQTGYATVGRCFRRRSRRYHTKCFSRCGKDGNLCKLARHNGGEDRPIIYGCGCSCGGGRRRTSIRWRREVRR